VERYYEYLALDGRDKASRTYLFAGSGSLEQDGPLSIVAMKKEE